MAFSWFRLATGAEVPAWHEERMARDELPVLILFDGWASLFRERVVPWRISLAEKGRAQLEYEVLPAFVAGRRWYGGKSEAIKRVALQDSVEWAQGGSDGRSRWRIETGSGEAQTYFLPLTLAWEDGSEEQPRGLAPLSVVEPAGPGGRDGRCIRR